MRSGYGAISLKGRPQSAHRVSWEIHSGRSVPEGNLVLHTCNNKICTNPRHLKLGDKRENARDMASDGVRWGGSVSPMRGERSPACKLSDFQVECIRELYAAGVMTSRALGRMFDVSGTHILRLCRREQRDG